MATGGVGDLLEEAAGTGGRSSADGSHVRGYARTIRLASTGRLTFRPVSSGHTTIRLHGDTRCARRRSPPPASWAEFRGRPEKIMGPPGAGPLRGRGAADEAAMFPLQAPNLGTAQRTEVARISGVDPGDERTTA